MTVSVTLRATKGAALTHAELDGNFTNIKSAVESLQGVAPAGTSGQLAYFSGTTTVVGSTTFTVNTTDKKLIINKNTVLPTLLSDSALSIVAADNTATRVGVTTHGAAGMGAYAARSARGTAASPTASQTGDTLVSFEGWGYGATGWGASPNAFMRVYAAENWTDSAHGTYVAIHTTPVGGVVPAEAIRIAADKLVTLAAGLAVTGTTTLATSLSGLVKTTSGVVSAATAGTDYVAGGTGTLNQVSYFSGAGAITSSANLTFDGSTLTVATASSTIATLAVSATTGSTTTTSGAFTCAGGAGFAGQVTAKNFYAIYTATDMASFSGGYSIVKPTYTSNSSAAIWNVSNALYPLVGAGVTQSGSFVGFNNDVFRNSNGAAADDDGTGAYIIGNRIQYGHALGNASANPVTTEAAGIWMNLWTKRGSIGTAYGINISTVQIGAGTVTTLYGIKIDNMTMGTTSYSIYTGTGAISFGGALSVRDTTEATSHTAASTMIAGGLAVAKRTFNPKTVITEEGGFAIRVTAGENLVRGEIVACPISGGADDKVWKAATTEVMPVGVVFQSANANAEVIVVVSGIAYVLPEAGITATRGNVLLTSTSTAGRATQSAAPNTTEHWRECGHWLDQGSGNGVLARAILHFN